MIKSSRVVVWSVAALGGFVLLALGALWGVAMPVRHLPEPTGPHTVGTISLDLTDQARVETYSLSDDPGPRRIRAQIWYPAAERTGRRQAWMPDGRAHIRAIVEANGFPRFIWDHTVLMRSHSYEAAPILQADDEATDLPLVLISHGWTGYRGLHSDVAEDLASHGFVVVAAEHTYGAAAVRFKDGTIIQASSRILPSRGETPDFLDYANRLVTTFASDNRFLLGYLSGASDAGAVDPRIQGIVDRIDFDRLGLVGHSTGGGAMVDMVLGDRAVAAEALVGLDAWVEPLGQDRLESERYTVPSLFLRSEQWEGGTNDSFLVPFVERVTGSAAGNSVPVELRQVEGITHAQFSTIYMYRPAMQWMGLLGSADPLAFASEQRRAIREFLQAQLQQNPS
ncbi:MAG: alpha/beta hydrolase family protein [Spirochaetaceae bacterium]